MERPGESLTHGPVTLRRWRAADTETICDLVLGSLGHLRPWMSWAAEFGPQDAAQFTEQCERDWEAGSAFNYAIISGGAAAAALVDAAFGLPGIDRVEIVHDEANIASSGVPRKLGFAEIARRPRPDGPQAPAESGTDVVWRLTR